MKTDKLVMQTTAAPLFLIAAALILSSLYNCGPSAVGGGEIGNPITITGKVVDKNNRGVADMRVCLLAYREFNPVAASLADTAGKPFETVRPVAEAVTDSAGAYGMTASLQQKSYSIFGVQGADSTVMVYHPFAFSNQQDTLVFIHDAAAPGTVIVGITDSLFKPNEYVFVHGTTLFIKIDAIGRTTIQCPTGIHSFSYYSAHLDSIDMTVPGLMKDSLFSGGPITVREGSTTDISSLVHRISRPQRPSGDTIVDVTSQGNGILYTTGNAADNLGDTLEYRISWGAGSFTQWIVPEQASKIASLTILWPSPGTYSVRAQARSVRDTGVVSPYSDTLRVAVQ
jgi:hypothetical protein